MRGVLTRTVPICLVLLGLLWSLVVFTASAAPPLQGSIGVITSPKGGTSIRGSVVIEGSASHNEFWKYEVHYGRGVNPSNWTLIGDVHQNKVISGRLEAWNTNLVPDGIYALRLRVARKDGNYDDYFVRDLNVANTQPTETPTPKEETPAAPTITSTPLPATPTIVIEQPKRETPTAAATSAKSAAGQMTPTPAESPKISGRALLDAVWSGTKFVLVIFAGFGLLAILRAILLAIYRWIRKKIRKDEEYDDF